jgi:hypothetical protein
MDASTSDLNNKAPDTNSNSNVHNNSIPDLPVNQQPKVTPIYVNADEWRKIAPSLTKAPFYPQEGLQAKITSDGRVRLQPTSPALYRQIQTFLRDASVAFFSFPLPEDRTLKVVIRGIPTNIPEDEVKSELESFGFIVKNVKRFGANARPMPMCLVILPKTPKAAEIYNLRYLFYYSIIVESYKKIGPSQCFACQRFGHGSQNCGHPPRCVKCSGNHLAKDCGKTPEETPLCCNCGKDHTANFRGCEWYQHILKTKTPEKTAPKSPTNAYVPPSPPTGNPIQTTKSSYANVVKNQPTTTTSPSASQGNINSSSLIILLTDLLKAIATENDPKILITQTINSFITILTQNV